jgi:hypothetical protein
MAATGTVPATQVSVKRGLSIDKRVTIGESIRQVIAMRKLIPVLAAFALGGVAVGVVLNTQSRSAERRLKTQLEEKWTIEARDKNEAHGQKVSDQARAFSQRLRKMKEALRAQGVDGDVVENIVGNVSAPSPASSLRNPGEIIQELIAIKESGEHSRTARSRQLIKHTEALVDLGEVALPAIADFLTLKQDVDYGNNISGDSRYGRMYTDFLTPPTLRMGLFNVARRIGGESAEQILAGELKTTGLVVELVYLTKALDEMAPGRYKDEVLAAAHYWLEQPEADTPETESRMNRNKRAWLFNLLIQYKDETYVAQAKTQLIRQEKSRGRDGKTRTETVIDSSTFNYLTRVLDERSMPILRQAYENPELSDRSKSSIRQFAARNIGRSGDADSIVLARLGESLKQMSDTQNKRNVQIGDSRVRYYLNSMGSTRGATPDVVNSRRRFLSTLRGQTQNAKVQEMINKADARLVTMLDPEKSKKLGRFSLYDNRKRQ